MHTDKERYIKVHVHIYLEQTGNTTQDIISKCTQIKNVYIHIYRESKLGNTKLDVMSRCTQIKNVTSKCTYISTANWGTHRGMLYQGARR